VRIALISDVHANLVALDAVLTDAEARGAETIWNLGDTVGYGPDPNGVIARLRTEGAVSVLGNHDAAVTGQITTELFNPVAAEAAAWTEKELNDDARTHLSGLATLYREGDWSCVHGTLRDPIWEYLFTVEAAGEHFQRQQTPFSAVGHTHVPLLIRKVEGGGVEATPPSEDQDEPLGEGLLCVNPGSVGQPRDGDPRASYTLVDTSTGTVTHHRVVYDVPETQRLIAEAGLPKPLAERLELGR